MDEVGYHVKLGDGSGWYILASEGLKSWSEKLAAIMQLKICDSNGYPKLLFIRKKSEKDHCGEALYMPEESFKAELSGWDWKAQEIGDIRFWSRPDLKDVICEIGRVDENLDIGIMRDSLYPIYQRAQSSGGLPFHAGLVERDGKGVLLAGPAEAGKSTCCRRLPSPWRVLCDEETLVVRDNQKRYLAHPFPTWSEYLVKRSRRTWNIQENLPLVGIFFLEKAETDEVVPIGQGEAAVNISQSAIQLLRRMWSYLDVMEVKSCRLKLFDNACEIAGAVPAFNLRVSLKGRFWEKIESVLP